MIWGFIILISTLFIIIYVDYLKPMKNIKQYENRAINYALIRKYSNAAKILETMLTKFDLKGDIYYNTKYTIAHDLFLAKKYSEAIKYFDDVFGYLFTLDDIPNSEIYSEAILALIYMGEKERAVALYKNILEKNKDADKSDKFKKLKSYFTNYDK